MRNEQEPGSLEKVLADITAERAAQDRMWGVQEFPDGTGPAFAGAADKAKDDCADAWSRGELTWRHVLAEEFYEALAETDPEPLRNELVQTAAVAVKWIQSLDRRNGATEHHAKEGGGHSEKLVRDGIPDLIANTGRRPETRVAERGEYISLLRAKLYEEAGEYVETGDPAELADVLEVVHALAALHGMTPADLEASRSAKHADRGGFAQRIVMRLQP
jgi:predicted house-cleaning noncanonical NTP pyrophosphatase (MazG superfamily)